MVPSDIPSDQPSLLPSSSPSDIPSDVPSDQPSEFPSSIPSDMPSENPSSFPSAIPSLLPSLLPSDTPSECESEPNWKAGDHDTGVIFSGTTCDQITNTNLCTILLSDSYFTFGGKAVNEACCACGGSRYTSTQPSSVPSDAPSLTPSLSSSPTFVGGCVDDANWRIVLGGVVYPMGCDSIPDASSCPDPSVEESYNGKKAEDACCVCKP